MKLKNFFVKEEVQKYIVLIEHISTDPQRYLLTM